MPRFSLLALLAVSQVAAAQALLPTPLDTAAHRLRVQEFQQTLNQEFGNPQESPLTPAERQGFKGLSYYPVGHAYCVEAVLLRDSLAQPFAMETSTGRRPQYRKYGELRFVLLGQPQRLSVYQSLDLLKRPDLADYLFLPFTDLSNGRGSYGGGRYLDLRIPPKGIAVITLDFNRAYNPSCAYNHAYSCPVPPAENRLAVAVPVGVRSEK